MDRNCVITLRDEVNCNIRGLLPEHREELIKQWNLLVPNAYFMPAVKKGVWDGRIKFFHTTGNTYKNLLSDIIPWIADRHYNIDIVDNRPVLAHNTINPIDKDFFKAFGLELRYYQVNAVNAGIENGNGLLKLATGAGKTLIAACLAKVYEPLRSITIVPNVDLIIQTRDEWLKYGLGVGEYHGNKKDLDHTHIISTWQSLQNNRDILKDFGVIIVDEVHLGVAKIINELLTEGYGARIPFRFGLTGTIPKDKTGRITLRASLGDVLYEVKAKQLIDEGYLSNLFINVLELDDKIDDLQSDTKLETAEEKEKAWDIENSFLIKNKDRNNAIVDIIKSTLDGVGNTLILVDSVSQGKLFAKQLGCKFLYGDVDTEDRMNEYKDFEVSTGKVVVATFGIAKAGIDIKNLHNLFLIDVKKAFTKVIQSLGRGLRKGQSKFFLNVYDICSNASFSKNQQKIRLSYYKDEGYPYEVHVVKIKNTDSTFGD